MKSFYACRRIFELREIDLKNKPAELIEISNKATVPVLKTKLDKLKVKYPFTQLSNIEPNSNGSVHICFYEPLVSFFNLKLKRDGYLNKFSKNSIYKKNSRKFIEICRRKFIRSDGNHKKGIIRGECKKLKAAKASISRTFKTLVQKKYLRKIDILDYENFKIGIGFNLTKNGNDLAKKL